MLAMVTGFLAGGLHVLADPRHIHLLAPRGIVLPRRGGTVGGYLGLAQGSVVVLIGLVAVLGERLLGLEPSTNGASFVVGVLLVLGGLTVVYRLSLLEAHVHPHTHEGIEHEHVHLHAAPEQVHDHEQVDLEITGAAFHWSNLIGAIPSFVLPESDAVLYLVSYLAVSTLAMGGLGSWLGRARRRGADGSEVLRTGALFGYFLSGAGLVWAVAWWPL